MEIQALGYLGVGAGKLDEWTSFATGGLGMQVVDPGARVRAFRMDDRRQRIAADSTLPDGVGYFGWELADAHRSTRSHHRSTAPVSPCGESRPRLQISGSSAI